MPAENKVRDVHGLSQSFKLRADGAAFWEAWVGAALSRKGLYTVHHPFKLASEEGKHAIDYMFTWDIDVALDWPDAPATYWARLPVEIKSHDRSFTSPHDYPYPKKIICSQTSYNRKWHGKTHLQRDFLYVSQHTGAIIWLPCGSPVEFDVEMYDQKRGERFKAVQTDSSNMRDLDSFVESVKNRLG
jgi:hypothetical protein